MGVLRAEPLGWASFGVRILSGEDEVTKLKVTAFKGRGSFHLEGQDFRVEPKGFFLSHAELKKGTAILARARKSSPFRRRFEISSAGHRLVLESQSWTGREYLLLLGTQEVGWIKREGMRGRRLTLDFPDDVPLFLQIFLAYLVVNQAKREAAAAASGS